MEVVLLIKIGEITLKKGNRNFFEKILKNNMSAMLSGYRFSLRWLRGRYFIENMDEQSVDKIIEILSRCAGIISISRAIKIKKDLNELFDRVPFLYEEILKGGASTFKFESKRADKSFPLNSYELSSKMGEKFLDYSDKMTVDVKKPDVKVSVEVRDFIYIYYSHVKGLGGLPVGVSGKGLLMLSGGIDSPVAAIMMAKRGMKVDGLHFLSPPYTGDAAKEKVKKLSFLISQYAPGFRVSFISVTRILEEIAKHCNGVYSTVLLRIFMMKIANHFAKAYGVDSIITGESLSQVASQTINNLRVTDAQRELLVMRPLIAFDKIDIIEMARAFGTFETSIIQAEDCCTVFLAKHPVTTPAIEDVMSEYDKIPGKEKIIAEAIETLELFYSKDYI